MKKSDIPEVIKIEEKTFSLPFSSALFRKYLKAESFYCYVVEKEERVVGYMIFSFVNEEADLLNIAVDSNMQRRGVGSIMLNHIVDILIAKKGKRIFLEVRASNDKAKSFYERFGFFQINVKKDYYHDTNEDAIVYTMSV